MPPRPKKSKPSVFVNPAATPVTQVKRLNRNAASNIALAKAANLKAAGNLPSVRQGNPAGVVLANLNLGDASRAKSLALAQVNKALDINASIKKRIGTGRR